jgi:mono/diheme cytochrome c family protein
LRPILSLSTAPPTAPAAACVSAALLVLASTALAGGNADRGREVFALAAGCGCHTMNTGPVGAGGAKIATPFGTFYGTNITPDVETGIGAWSDEEIDAAIRGGHARGKGAEAPVMPYNWYAGMSDRDAADLIAFLRTLTPVHRENTPHEGELPLSRWAYWGWRLLFFSPPPRPAEAPVSGVERGRYLADHVSLCADCHTPRTLLGAVDTTRYMAGTPDGPGGAVVPNITPHADGVADWDVADLANVLESGMMPNYDNVQGAMADVVDGVGGGAGYKDAAAADRLAIAEYLKTVPPIANEAE